MTDKTFRQALIAHDNAVAAKGLCLWAGSEPTFTDRFSELPQWLTDSLGDEKLIKAQHLVKELYDLSKSNMVIRSIGRQYSSEPYPRWSFGLYSSKSEQTFNFDPPDPVLIDSCHHADEFILKTVWHNLAEQLRSNGWQVCAFQTKHDNFYLRIVTSPDEQTFFPDNITTDIHPHSPFMRPSLHSQAIPLEGIQDELSNNGLLLILIGIYEEEINNTTHQYACIELPTFKQTSQFQLFLNILSKAVSETALDHLIFSGFPPPVDANVSWTTVTPDPAVIEINMTPSATSSAYFSEMCLIFEAAQKVGLCPQRIHYNGNIVDSGGGGHITLGGSNPEKSPFVNNPKLILHLLAYFNQHPSLSYYFSIKNVGSSGQSPRTDENLRDSFKELQLALKTLNSMQSLNVDTLWHTLAPFLTDHTGNAHRSEINIEKLFNPYLPNRGKLGVVEFRAFKMAPTPHWSAAVMTLIRAITAMMNSEQRPVDLIQWGEQLHDRFALPYYLEQDLQEILNDLSNADLGLDAPLIDTLREDSHRLLGDFQLAHYHISINKAIEFWPLIGNVASQENGASRLVDGSTARIQIIIRELIPESAELDDWQLIVENHRIPLLCERDSQGRILLMGIRYRTFLPNIGLHPKLLMYDPLSLILVNHSLNNAVKIKLYEWQPDKLPYDGLPMDSIEAIRRCEQRFVVEQISPEQIFHAKKPPAEALSSYCFDLRWVSLADDEQ
jgi:uncharacterized protein (DUF2126 family)